MITCYTLDGISYKEGFSLDSLDSICSSLKSNWRLLHSLPVEVVILLLDGFSKKLSSNKELLRLEGVSFLSIFFKKHNVESLIKNSLGDKAYLNDFILTEDEKCIKAQGRGMVCHWIAGNVPTLTFYSAFQALLAKNTNLIRVPKESIPLVLQILDVLNTVEISYNNEVYHGEILSKNISIIHFDSNNHSFNQEMSSCADARVFFGGEDAIHSLCSLSKKTTCKDLIFGPKYSFAVFDKTALESNLCEKYLENLVKDMVIFNQEACSSPHVVFIEKSVLPLSSFVEKLSKAFQKLEKKFPNILDGGTAAKVINERGKYALSLDKDLCCSKDLGYTILINQELCLENPIGGRSIFVKVVDTLSEVTPLITSKVQTIGMACEDKNKLFQFADAATAEGVDRIVSLGLMNLYDSPWDGYYMIHELIRWCSITII